MTAQQLRIGSARYETWHVCLESFRGCDAYWLASPGRSRAQDYPSRAITVVVPFPPGGASDVVARIVTNQMSKILGQSIIIENVSGAGGTVGSARVAAAAPDGYTLLAAAMGSHVAAPVLTPNLKYDPVADFVPIGFTAHSPASHYRAEGFPGKRPEGIRRKPPATG